MDNFDLKKYLAEGKINENQEIFSDDELDYISDTMIEMYEKLGLDAGGGETDIKKAIALSDRIESCFPVTITNASFNLPSAKYVFRSKLFILF